MAVDPQSRARLAESTRWLVGARITNLQFDDSIPKSDDPAIGEIYNQFLWLLYCDMREHRLVGADKLTQSQEAVAKCCVVFLKSDFAYSWPVLSSAQSALLTVADLVTLGIAGRRYFKRARAAGDMEYWPFVSEAQYASAIRSPSYLSGAGAN